MKPLILAIDFDDTIAYKTDDLIPVMFLPFAKEVINWAYDRGCQIIIWTCRPTEKRRSMKDFLKANGVRYNKINKNADGVNFTNSRKIFYDLCIDDRNYGAEIDWMKIKQTIKKLLIGKLAEEILLIRESSAKDEMRGRVLDVVLQGLPKPKCLVEKKECEKVAAANFLTKASLDEHVIKDTSFLRKMKVSRDDIIKYTLPNNGWGYFISKMRTTLLKKWEKIGEDLAKLITPTPNDWTEAIRKFKKKLTNKDYENIFNRMLLLGKKKPTEEFRDKFLNAKERKEQVEEIIGKIKNLASIVKLVIAQITDIAPMLRGKPNKDNPDVGMDEAEQKMYDGVDKRYDQLKIIRKERDWLDNEKIIEDLVDERAPTNPVASDAYLYTTNEIDYYYENPKGTGDKIPEGIPVDEEAMKLKVDEKLINPPEEVEKEDKERDNTQKYILPDQKLYNKRYWEEKIEPMKHSV